MEEKVSVIMPCYNQGKFIKEALESVFEQTYKNIEIVIFNDGSNDNSSDVIEDFIKDRENIIFINESENRGVVNARNTAIERCSGEYILPLDADDKIEKTYIEKAVNVLREDKGIGIVYCDCELFGSKTEKWDLPNYDALKILYNNMIFTTAMYRKSDFEKAGGYKDYMQGGYEDYDLWLSFIELGLGVYKIPEVLFYYRQYEIDKTSRAIEANKKEYKLRKELIKHHESLFLDNPQFMHNTFRALLNLEYIDRLEAKRKRHYKTMRLLGACSIFLCVINIALILYLLIK